METAKHILKLFHFCRAMRCISAAYVVMRCLSVCLSVCLSRSCVASKRIRYEYLQIFLPPGSQAILVFPCQTGCDIPRGTPLTGASNAGGVGKKRDSGRISGFAAYRSTVLSTVRVTKCKK